MTEKKDLPLSMAASAIALRGVRLFLAAGKAAAERRHPSPVPKRKPKAVTGNKIHQDILENLLKCTRFNRISLYMFGSDTNCVRPTRALTRQYRLIGSKQYAAVARLDMPYRQLKEKTLDLLYRNTHFSKHELEALHSMYKKLVLSAQSASSTTGIGQSAAKIDGIDQNTFRDVMHNTFDVVTEEVILDRVWVTWERGASGGEGAIKFEAWARGLSILLRGNEAERRTHCFSVYDLNGDGFITRDEMFILLKNSLLKQPGDEDPDEGVRDLVELVLKKLDVDGDGKISMDDYGKAVEQEPLLLEAFGQCMPTKRHAATFLKTLNNK